MERDRSDAKLPAEAQRAEAKAGPQRRNTPVGMLLRALREYSAAEEKRAVMNRDEQI
jgi:hypothetical protein